MKLIFKLLILTSLSAHQLAHANVKLNKETMILFSGTPSKEFRKMLNSSLYATLPEWKELSLFEEGNPKCVRREEYLIQFCIKGDKLDIVHQDKKGLQRTLSKLMMMDDSEKVQYLDGLKGI